MRDTVCDEIQDGIYRISRYFPDLAPPDGLTVNQFLVLADEPLLVHTGFGSLWSELAGAIERLVPVARLRWISFGHVEADECGALSRMIAVAPHARVVFAGRGCAMALRDLTDRPPVVITDGDAVDLGGRRVRFLATPHVPHNWESQVLYEEATSTLLCGDLFTQSGRCRAVADDIVTPALDTEAQLRAAVPGPAVPATLRTLAQLEPRTLATMHGGSYTGDGSAALCDLAAGWERRIAPDALFQEGAIPDVRCS